MSVAWRSGMDVRASGRPHQRREEDDQGVDLARDEALSELPILRPASGRTAAVFETRLGRSGRGGLLGGHEAPAGDAAPDSPAELDQVAPAAGVGEHSDAPSDVARTLPTASRRPPFLRGTLPAGMTTARRGDESR